MAIVDQSARRSASVIAGTHAELTKIDTAQFLALVAHNPRFLVGGDAGHGAPAADHEPALSTRSDVSLRELVRPRLEPTLQSGTNQRHVPPQHVISCGNSSMRV